MLEYLEPLCRLTGASGDESRVAEYVRSVISPYCRCEIDRMGNLTGFRQGKSRPNQLIMLDVHMDEVGLMISSINEDGFLSFSTVGGVNVESLLGARVRFGDVIGVIGLKPVHLAKGEERETMPDRSALTVDIGAKDKADAQKHIRVGQIGTFESEYVLFGDGYLKARAIDDRVGCAILIDLILQEPDYDFCFSFSVQEEIGLRGARVAAYALKPDRALCLEATTAADLAGMPENKTVCCLGQGAVVSFMDGATLYDSRMYQDALSLGKENGISVQSKRAVAGGNDAGSIHLTREGIPSFTISVPCRYLHSPACVISLTDAVSVERLAAEMLRRMAEDEV